MSILVFMLCYGEGRYVFVFSGEMLQSARPFDLPHSTLSRFNCHPLPYPILPYLLYPILLCPALPILSSLSALTHPIPSYRTLPSSLLPSCTYPALPSLYELD